MAQLTSPGVSVTVTDESFYSTAAPGTVPLIVVASAENKQNASGTGTAVGTEKANAGQVYLLTSQRELVDTFGTPVFKTDVSNNPIHAGEQNEYGLQTAYSYLGVSNRAYVVRADIDLSELNASASEPTGNPADGTFWLDTANTKFGIFEWNSAAANVTGGQTFTNKIPTVITDSAKVANYDSLTGDNDGPLPSIGKIGDYAIVAVSNLNKLWFKKSLTDTAAGTWVEVGSTTWKKSWPAAQGSVSNPSIVTGDTLTITTISGSYDVTSVSSLSALATGINAQSIPGITAKDVNNRLEIYSTGVSFNVTGTTVVKVGLTSSKSYFAPALSIAPHTQVPLYKTLDNPSSDHGYPTGSLWIKTTSPNLGANWVVKKFNSATNSWETVSAPLYESNKAALYGLDRTGGGSNLALSSLYVKWNDDEQSPVQANFKLYVRSSAGATTIQSSGTLAADSYTFTIAETSAGSSNFSTPASVTFVATTDAEETANNFLSALTAALTDTNIVASATSTNKIVISHAQGGDIKFVDTDGTAIGTLFADASNFYADPDGTASGYVASNWTSTVNGTAFAEASSTALTTNPENGRLWYNSITDEVDLLIHNGTTWVGYQFEGDGVNTFDSPVLNTGALATDPNGPIISATKPLKQSDGTDLANNDLWIDTSNLENFPTIYRYNSALGIWSLIDTSDQTTENGILFADARAGTSGGSTDVAPSGTIVELLTSDFLDPDAPDPALYPRGMLLWNLRRSGFNVKRFEVDSINTLTTNTRYNDQTMSGYYPHRWVTEAANQQDGTGSFGRVAQRAVVVQALQSLLNSNQQIRDEESRIFNLIACPGYPEVIDEMVALNYDRGITAFVVGDTPARLVANATSLTNWSADLEAGTSGSAGASSFDEYLGIYYPWGYTSDNLGNDIVVPPSHMVLRTMALSDNVSYPWFAPAGTRRGGVTNANAVGYVDSEGEFVSVAINTGLRDTLSTLKINPIAFISGSGLVVYAQHTRARNASALDRVNVARLVVYLRRRFSQLAKPYVFEPNDKITRDELKGAAENLLLELVGQRALYDYIVVCDETNNTPARIDRNELYLDVAIEPVKAVEFIYIPLRLKNTGEIQSLAS